MGSSVPSEHFNNPYLFIDTCVIQDAGNNRKVFSETVINLLTDLSKEGFRVVISEFTVYENLQGLWGKRAIEASKILNSYESKAVSRDVLVVASFLQGLYREEGYENIDAGDKIIASTCILEDGLILTRNHKDFPHPFFITVRSIPLSYKIHHYKMTVDYSLYKPNLELINRRIEEKDKV